MAAKGNQTSTGQTKAHDVIKAVILGGDNVGKTSIFQLYETQKVHLNTIATIGANFTIKPVVLPEDPSTTVKIMLWDTNSVLSHEERHLGPLRTFYKTADIVILVYDITDFRSFESIQKLSDDVLKHSTNDKLKIAVIGNKVDLEEKKREVPIEETQIYATQINATFFEMSAHNLKHYDLLYDTILTLVLQVRGQKDKVQTQEDTPPSRSRPAREPAVARRRVKKEDVSFCI